MTLSVTRRRRGVGLGFGLALGLLASVGWSLASPAAALAQARGEQIGLPLGSQPDLVEIEDLNGQALSLAELVGGAPAVIEFWASWCGNCAALHPYLERAHADYGDRVQFVNVAVAVGQTPRGIRKHLKRHPVSYPTVWDTEGRAARAFKAPVTSYIVMLDASGKVVYTGAGREQDVDKAIRESLHLAPSGKS